MDIFTIGHSNLSISGFLQLLRRHGVTSLVDVRSEPYSKYAEWFNQRPLAEAVRREGIEYIYKGRELGGKPADPDLRGPRGDPDWDRVEASEAFRRGIDEAIQMAATKRLALLCAEGDPRQCHREKLLGRVLRRRGCNVLHILGDGSVLENVQESLF